MKQICQIIVLISIYAAITAPTPHHLGGLGIFLSIIVYNILSAVVWGTFLWFAMKSSRTKRSETSGLLSALGKWSGAAALAFLLFGLALAVKQFAYGPHWSVSGRPMFAFGWPIPWRWETQNGQESHPWVMAVNAWSCFGASLFLCGFRRLKSFAVAFLSSFLLSAVFLLVTGNTTRACNFFFPPKPCVQTNISVFTPMSASSHFTAITNEWFQGHQTNVLTMANQRLAANTNDIAGLLMKASYDFDFSDATALSNTLVRVLAVGETITTPAFSNAFRLVRLDIRGTFKTISTETPEEHAADMLKIMGPGHPMAYDFALEALDDDGYFNP